MNELATLFEIVSATLFARAFERVRQIPSVRGRRVLAGEHCRSGGHHGRLNCHIARTVHGSVDGQNPDGNDLDTRGGHVRWLALRDGLGIKKADATFADHFLECCQLSTIEIGRGSQIKRRSLAQPEHSVVILKVFNGKP